MNCFAAPSLSHLTTGAFERDDNRSELHGRHLHYLQDERKRLTLHITRTSTTGKRKNDNCITNTLTTSRHQPPPLPPPTAHTARTPLPHAARLGPLHQNPKNSPLISSNMMNSASASPLQSQYVPRTNRARPCRAPSLDSGRASITAEAQPCRRCSCYGGLKGVDQHAFHHDQDAVTLLSP